MRFDVAVAGGGPAASAAALFLAREGASVTILERGGDAGDKPGESIAPAARPLLEQLGMWDGLAHDGHLPCHGNRSSWGSDDVGELPFVFTPYGHGWHLDRRRFEKALYERACAAGAVRRTHMRVVDAKRDRGGWRLCCEGGEHVEADVVIDATGRAGTIARRQGAQRLIDDTLIALVAFLPCEGEPDPDSFTLVEATEHGWWYTAPIPDGRLAAMFVTDADIARTRDWESLLAPRTRARIEEHAYVLCDAPRRVDAGSARLDRVAGDGWLAIGDAAMALDPLSSHGIASALATGIAAAHALLTNSAERYVHVVDAMWSGYVSSRRELYAQERRWRDAAFWRRRQA
ncbi:MAG TPA: tryptophan 7-halogenase [Thermoanaerobaculia bacterium]|nr:tryptophan 7-halogenase [Thermoanaerobaculia bacterium]